jgi:hypothetical protein
MLEFATWAADRWRSDFIASGISGGNANHERKATKNPTCRTKNKQEAQKQEYVGDVRQLRWNARPYGSMRLNIGMV